MPVYNVYWKAIQSSGGSNSGGKTVTASTSSLAKSQIKAEVQKQFPNATVVITDVTER